MGAVVVRESLWELARFFVHPDQAWVSAAAGVFLLVIVGILLSVRKRARVGLQAIAALRESAPQIARSLADRRPALNFIDETVKRLPSRRNHDLDLALSEIRAGLVRYQDDFSLGPDGRTIAHVRLTEVFSASLPERLIALPRALAASRLIVQTGLALSVGFVLFALVQSETDPARAVTGTVAFKFLFTIVGLLGSVLIQLVAGANLRRAERAFVDLETEIENQANLTVVTYSAGSFALLRSLADTQAGMDRLLVDFRSRVDELVAGTAALTTAATKLSETAQDAANSVETMQRAGAKIGAEVGRRIDAGTEAVRAVSDTFASSLSQTAASAQVSATAVLDQLEMQISELVKRISAEAERQTAATTSARQESDAAARSAIQTAVTAVSAAAEKAAADLQRALSAAGSGFADALDRSTVELRTAAAGAAQDLGRQGKDVARSLSEGAREVNGQFRILASELEQRVDELRRVLERLAPDALEAERRRLEAAARRREAEAPEYIIAPDAHETRRDSANDKGGSGSSAQSVSDLPLAELNPDEESKAIPASDDKPERAIKGPAVPPSWQSVPD